MESAHFLSTLIIVWLAAKIAGEGMQRLGQTAVLGELLAGVVIGPGALGLVSPSDRLAGFAEIGIVILLFEIGLESDLDELLRSGAQSILVALVGMVSPFFLGFALARAWGLPPIESVFIGAALTATSVGITARVLADLGRLQDSAAKLILGAAVVDDVLGLVILSVVTALVRTGGVSATSLTLLSVKAVVFLVIAIVLGVRLAPSFIRRVDRMQARGSLIVYAVLFCTLLAVLAERAGLAALIGAFAAGLILAKTERRTHIEERIKPVADLFVPIFFVSIGVKVDLAQLHPFAPRGALAFAGLLTLVAIAAKLTAGLAVYQRDVRRWCVGVGLIPRGEVGLVFAGVGLASAVVDADLYAAVVVMIMLTTFIAPLWLKALYR
jgi:Kef-type K+ transport system membrane component KefB